MSNPRATYTFSGKDTLIRHCSHVRRALICWTYVAADVFTSHIADALNVVLRHLESIQQTSEYFGLLNKNGA
eukprot:8419236-Prorocentrum_lima.AAC.1